MADEKLRDEEGRLAALRRYETRSRGGNEPFQRIVDLVRQILDVPMAAISLIDAETQWFTASAGIDRPSLPRADAFCAYTVLAADPLIVADVGEDGRFAANALVTGEPHVKSYLGAPLTTPDGYNIGTLCAFDTAHHAFDARQASIMQNLAGMVVEQFELQQITRQDALTGALTRRGFFAELEREFLRATRYDRPSSLLVIDIDHFRAVNDRFGHPAGDAVLTSIANACIATMRRSDILGRIGGEEFGLLLPETEPEEARGAAERIRRTIERTIVEANGVEVRVTISLGIAPVPAPGEGVSSWLGDAEAALRDAKQSGRNQVAVGGVRRPVPAPAVRQYQAAVPH